LASRATLGHLLRQEALLWQPDAIFGIGNFHIPVLAAYNAAGGSPAKTLCKLSNPLRLSGFMRSFAPLHSLGLRRLTKGIDALVAMSPSLRDEARTVLKRADILLAPEPILSGPPLVPAAGRPAPNVAPLLVCAGRLERQKNFSLALEAFAALPPSRNARLAILGEGSQRRRLEKKARRLGIADRVHMPGHVADIGPWLQQATAFLSTSNYEGYPAVLIEAIAMGVPVVTTESSPAIREIIEDKAYGEIVARDASALAMELDRRIQLPPRTSAEAGPGRLQKHRVEWAAGAYLRLLDDLAASRLPAAADAPADIPSIATARTELAPLVLVDPRRGGAQSS
jgi:glycosyltransferase involved in cell wall biosynthesis